MSKLLSEAKACLVLAIPLAGAQLAQASGNFFETIMMGLLGSQTIAAGALGGIVFSSFTLICTGIISAVGAIAALAYGAGDTDKVRRLTSQGIWLAILLSVPSMFLIWYLGPILQDLGQDPSNVKLAQNYLHAVVWGFPAALGFAVLKNVVSALNRPKPIMAIMIFGLVLNIAANYILMFGKFGLPACGIAGIGWGNTISLWVILVMTVCFILWDKHLVSYKIFSKLDHFDSRVFWDIIQTGWPTGVLVGVKNGLFVVTAFLMGYLGTVTLAAHQIALQAEVMTFMVPVGISIATTIRVGQMIGQNDYIGARRAGYVGIGLAAIFMGIMSLIFWTHPDKIAALYLDLNNPDNQKVVKITVYLLGIAALFQISDGIQVTANSALRALKDTRVPMLIGIFSYLCVGLLSSCIMGWYLGWKGSGLWFGLVIGICLAAVILTWRFYQVISSLIQKENSTALASANNAGLVKSNLAAKILEPSFAVDQEEKQEKLLAFVRVPAFEDGLKNQGKIQP